MIGILIGLAVFGEPSAIAHCQIRIDRDEDWNRRHLAECPEDAPDSGALTSAATQFLSELSDNLLSRHLPHERELVFYYVDGAWTRNRTFYRHSVARYPTSGLERRLAGVCRVAGQIAPDGRPLEIEAECATSRRRETGEYFGGNSFEREALEAYERWRYEPWPTQTEEATCFVFAIRDGATRDDVEDAPC